MFDPWTVASIALKTTLLVAAAGFAVRVAARQSAAWRHLVWSSALTLSLLMPIAVLVLAGCGSDSDSGNELSSGGGSAVSKHERQIYSQQKSTCQIEQKMDTPDYRNHDGADDPEGYAEWAAEHGFYKVTTEAERNAAINGCLAGLR